MQCLDNSTGMGCVHEFLDMATPSNWKKVYIVTFNFLYFQCSQMEFRTGSMSNFVISSGKNFNDRELWNICEVESGPMIRRQIREKTALTSDLTTKVAQQTKDGQMVCCRVDTLMAVQVGRPLRIFKTLYIIGYLFVMLSFTRLCPLNMTPVNHLE